MLTVFAIMEVVPGKKQQVLTIARANLANVRAEEGCLEYRLVEDVASIGPLQTLLGENKFAFIERWQSLNALEKHLTTPHMRAYFEQTETLVIDKAIHVLQSADE